MDENRFASGGADNKIIIWNTQSGNKELVLENNARVESLAKLENNRIAAINIQEAIKQKAIDKELDIQDELRRKQQNQ